VDYVAQSAAGEAATRHLIEELVRTQEPLLVWGAGTLTRHLLATTPLGCANVVAFVDSSPHLHGAELAGRKILAATELGGRPERILICSVVFAREIGRMIRSELRLPNPVIMLSELKNVVAGEW
jgi:FlaA1/EpsC-like NDP-sugar epimerase